MLPRPGAGESTARFVVRLVIAVAAVGVLVPAVIGAAHSAHMGAYVAARYNDAGSKPDQQLVVRMEYLGAAMGRELPAGAKVYIDEPDEVWSFWLQEQATMHALVVTGDRAGAGFVLRRRADPASPVGMSLDVTPVGR
jgi:hypothetical protein